MQTNRILALTLIVVCFFAAIVAARQPTTTPPTSDLSSSSGDFLSRVSSDRIAVISLQGPISSDALGVTGANALANRMSKLAENERVKGVVLRINSPGGTVGASQELYRTVEKVRQEKPIVATVSDIAASGGYYVASAADEIIANPGSLVGSIGVIIQGFNAAELLDNIGVDPQTIKTGPYKDLLSPTRPLTTEGRELLQGLVDSSYGQFIAAVSRGRQHLRPDIDKVLNQEAIAKRKDMSEALVRTYADGRVFTGEQALDLGLIDELGGVDDAVERLQTLIGNRDIPVSTELPDLNVFWDFFRSQMAGLVSQAGGESLLRSLKLAGLERTGWEGVKFGASDLTLQLDTSMSPLQWQSSELQLRSHLTP